MILLPLLKRQVFLELMLKATHGIMLMILIRKLVRQQCSWLTGRKPPEKRRKKKKLVLVKLLKEFTMLNFYDCDKNLSETDFNEVEKN